MHAKPLKSCPTLCNSMDCSTPGSSVHGILQARILEVAMPSPRGLTHVFYIYCIGSWILYHSCHLGSSKHIHICLYGHLSLGRLGLSSSLYPSCSIYHLLCTKGMLIGIIMYKELDEWRAGVERKWLLELSITFVFFTLNVNIAFFFFFFFYASIIATKNLRLVSVLWSCLPVTFNVPCGVV